MENQYVILFKEFQTFAAAMVALIAALTSALVAWYLSTRKFRQELAERSVRRTALRSYAVGEIFSLRGQCVGIINFAIDVYRRSRATDSVEEMKINVSTLINCFTMISPEISEIARTYHPDSDPAVLVAVGKLHSDSKRHLSSAFNSIAHILDRPELMFIKMAVVIIGCDIMLEGIKECPDEGDFEYDFLAYIQADKELISLNLHGDDIVDYIEKRFGLPDHERIETLEVIYD